MYLVAVASMAVIAEDDHLEEEGEELTSMQDEAAYLKSKPSLVKHVHLNNQFTRIKSSIQ